MFKSHLYFFSCKLNELTLLPICLSAISLLIFFRSSLYVKEVSLSSCKWQILISLLHLRLHFCFVFVCFLSQKTSVLFLKLCHMSPEDANDHLPPCDTRLSTQPANRVWPSADQPREANWGGSALLLELITFCFSSSTMILSSKSQILMWEPTAAQSQYQLGLKHGA